MKKITKYSGLRVELAKMWNSEYTVIPVVVGGLGAVSHNFTNYLTLTPAALCVAMCLKITVLGSEKIMRFVLSRKEMYYVVFTMIPHAYLFVVDYLLKHMWWYQSYVMIYGLKLIHFHPKMSTF